MCSSGVICVSFHFVLWSFPCAVSHSPTVKSSTLCLIWFCSKRREHSGGRGGVDGHGRLRQVAGSPASKPTVGVCVHPEVPNSQPGSHSLTFSGQDWRGHSEGSTSVHPALSLTPCTYISHFISHTPCFIIQGPQSYFSTVLTWIQPKHTDGVESVVCTCSVRPFSIRDNKTLVQSRRQGKNKRDSRKEVWTPHCIDWIKILLPACGLIHEMNHINETWYIEKMLKIPLAQLLELHESEPLFKTQL